MWVTEKNIYKLCKEMNLSYDWTNDAIYYSPTYDITEYNVYNVYIRSVRNTCIARSCVCKPNSKIWKNLPAEIEICRFSTGTFSPITFDLVNELEWQNDSVSVHTKTHSLIYTTRKLKKELLKSIKIIEDIKDGCLKWQMDKKLKELEKDF